MNNFNPTKPSETSNVAPMFPYPPPTMDAASAAAFYQWYMQATMCDFQPQQFFQMAAAAAAAATTPSPLPIIESPPQRPTYPSNNVHSDRKHSFHPSNSSREMHRSSTNKYSYSSEPSFRSEQRNYRYPPSKRPRTPNQPIPDEYRE